MCLTWHHRTHAMRMFVELLYKHYLFLTPPLPPPHALSSFLRFTQIVTAAPLPPPFSIPMIVCLKLSLHGLTWLTSVCMCVWGVSEWGRFGVWVFDDNKSVYCVQLNKKCLNRPDPCWCLSVLLVTVSYYRKCRGSHVGASYDHYLTEISSVALVLNPPPGLATEPQNATHMCWRFQT